MAFFFGFREDHTVLMPHPEPAGRKHMNITRRLKSFTALALSLCMGLQFYPVLGEETTEPVTTDLSTSTSVDWTLNTYTARNDGTAFSLGLTFVEGTVLHAGDTMSLALPEGYSFSDITEALPLYAVRNGVPGELLGSYTISGNVLSLVFNEVTDLTGVTTELTVTGTQTETVTEGYYKEQTWTMEQDEDGTVNTVTFTVPSSDIMNWTWVSVDGTWTTTVDAIQQTTDGTTTLVLSNAITNTASYTFTLPEGIKTEDGNAELSYAPMNPDGTQSQSISAGTYSVTENTLTANVTTIPTEAVTVSLPFTWSTEPLPTSTPEVVDEELVEAITQENEKLNETPAPTTSPVVTATPEVTETPVPMETPVTTPEPTETPIVTPTPEPTETPEAASNEINMMAEGRVEKDEVIEYGTWSMSASYNGVSNTQDIYWIDNSNGEETRPTQEQFNNLFNKDSINLKATMTNSGTGGTASPVTFKDVMRLLETYQQTGIDNFAFDTANLGGTGHWQATVTHLPETITLRRTNKVAATVDADGNVLTTRDVTETHTIQLSDWTLEPTVPDKKDDQGNTISIDPIPGSDTSTGYSFVNVFDDPDTTDVDYVDQNGRPRSGAASLGEGWYFVQETDYQADIVLRRGNNVLSTADDVDTLINTIKNVYTFYYDTGFPSDQPGALSGKLSLASDVYVDVKREGFAEAESVPTLTFTIRDLEKYNLDGSEIIYDIDQTTTEDDTNSNKSNVINATNFHVFNDQNGKYYGDYFSEEINNDPVSNHGTDITKCYDGGTIYLTLTGETNYQATKIWQDKFAQANNQLRPEVKFELWRYTVTKGTNLNTAYQHASPVQATVDRNSGGTAANSLQTATDVLEGAVASDDVDYSIDFKPDFVMGPVSSEDYKKTVNYLPKYDPEGNSYVYFARETMSGDNANKYRVEYGSLDENGKFTGDKLPDGMTGGRPSGDTGIYNGGTVSNVLNDTTQATVRKTWIADAFQSELGDVDVVLTLQRSSDNGQHWENVTKADGTDLTYTMGKSDVPFSAENLIQEHSESVPTYDNEGNELIYRWVETAIKQNDQEIKINDGEFVLHQNGQDVTYNSYVQNLEREERVTSIINQIDDKTQYHVKKQWEGFPEGFEAPPISLVMYRSNSVNEREKLLVKNGDTVSEDTYFQLDGNADKSPTELFVKNPDFDPNDLESEEYIHGGYVQETKSWSAQFTDLDLYDVGGSPFDYIVLEGNTAGQEWSADYSMDIIDVDGEDVVLMTIVNRPVGGREIYVRKRWLDDGDEQHRGDVTMTAYAINFSETVTADNFTFNDLIRLDAAVLKRDNNWWDRIGIPAKPGTEANPEFYTDKEIIVLETTITDAKPGEAGAANTNLGEETYTADQLHKIYDDQHPQAENEDHAWVPYQTRFHKYEATFSVEVLEDVSFYTVTNRRLGNINLTVTKKWVDGATGTDVSEQRNAFIKALNDKGYDLVMQLTASDTQDFDVVAPEIGENSIHLVHEDVPIRKPKNPNDLTQGYEQTTSVQVVYHTNSSSMYYFWNLPKYNENGKIVRYTVREMAQNRNTKELVSLNKVIQDNQISCEYVFDMAQTRYVTSDSLQPDDQQMVATNRLSGTKRVFFWKEWNDAYRLQNKQRPDIYLDLYQSVKGTNTISGLYRQGSWTFYNDPDITFFDYGYLDKYDEQGREYIYYAKESMNLTNASQFDYQPVDYKYLKSLEDPSMSTDENINTVIKTLEDTSSIGDEAGYATSLSDNNKTDSDGNQLLLRNGETGPYVLKEYGVFSNSIRADVEISGKKIWANVPTGFEDADLVDVTFYLFRYLPNDDIPDTNDSIVYGEDDQGKETITLNEKSPSAFITIHDWEEIKYQGNYAFELEYYNENLNTVDPDDGKITVIPATPAADNFRLEKYDRDGNLYTYVLRERGYFGGSDADEADKEGDGIGFVFTQPTINNFAITNSYIGTEGEISLRKILELNGYDIELNSNDKLSSVSFRLTREYKRKVIDENGKVKEEWISDTDFYQDKVVSYGDLVDGSEDINFEKLPIYAPNGNLYRYTVTENPGVNDLVDGGYQAYAKVGIVEQDAFKADGSYNVDNLLQKVVDDSGSVSYVYQYAYPKVKEEQGTVIEQIFDFIAGIPEAIGLVEPKAEEPDTSSVTFLNVYTREFAPLEFGKTWADFGQSATRFTVPMTFDVYRSADAQPGQGNAISEYKVGQIVIDLKEAAKDQTSIELTKTDTSFDNLTITDELNKDGVFEVAQPVNYTIAFTYEGNAANPAIHMTLHDYQTFVNGSVLINSNPTNANGVQQGAEIVWNLQNVKAGDKVELTVQLNETTAGNDPVVTVTYDDQTMTPAIVSDREETKTNSAMDAIRKVVITANDPTKTLGTCSDWTVTIKEFSVYAPNGMPWKYKLTEYDEYPYTATVKSILFTYAKEQDKFVAQNNTKFVNDTSVSVRATKSVRDSENVNTPAGNNIETGLWNYTGFDITLNYEVYAKFVVADAWDNQTEQGTLSQDSALYKMLHELNGSSGSEWVSLAEQMNTSGDVRNPYVQSLFNAIDNDDGSLPEKYNSFRASINYEDDTSFQSKGTDKTISGLPRVFTLDGSTVYVSYILMETCLEMRDAENKSEAEPNGRVIYKETFTPKFLYETMPPQEQYPNLYEHQQIYKEGDAVVTYSLNASAEILDSKGQFTQENYLFMKPLFSTDQDALLKSDTVKKYKFTDVEMLPIVWIDRYDTTTTSRTTFINEQINTIDVTNLRVRKNWQGDNNNWYGSRPVDKSGNWVVEYVLQIKDKNNNWQPFPVEKYAQEQTISGQTITTEKYHSITGTDTDSTNYINYMNLPAGGIIRIKTAMGTDPETYSYKYVAIDSNTFEYRVCEITPDGTVIEPTGTKADTDGKTYSTTSTRYNEAYTVTYPEMVEENYKEGDDKVKIDTYGIINTLDDIEFYAAKDWNDFGYTENTLSGTITFELQYLKDMKDESGNDKTDEWVSFEIHDGSSEFKKAIVTLDGKAEQYEQGKEPLYYEYESWKAKWTDVPEVMPGSVKNTDGKTQYRVVEVIEDNNAYATTDGVTGSGTQLDPYVLVGNGTEYSPFTILNEFTVLDVSKTVVKPVGTDKKINSNITNQIFEFTITPYGDSIPNSAMYQIYKKDPTNPDNYVLDGDLKQLKDKDGKATFKLTDGQFARIYGLKKGVPYTVEETAVSDSDGSLDYKVTYDLTECKYSELTKTWSSQTTKNQNSVTLPANKPECNKNPQPQIAVTNERLGKVTITKTNLDGTEGLEGMTFKLEVQTGTDNHGNAIWDIAQMWDPGTTWNETTEKWVDHPEVTSDEKGIVIFKNLELDNHYKLTEVSAPGYHKYPFSIEFDLPYKPTTDDKPAEDISADYYYSIKNAEGKEEYFYPEIKMTIENDQAFIMPDTSGTGFFWPGMIGVAVSVLSAGGYVVTRKKKKKEEENEEVN